MRRDAYRTPPVGAALGLSREPEILRPSCATFVTMTERGAARLITGGVIAASLGFVVTLVFAFQPWRTCEDDVAIACAALPHDAALTIAGIVVLAAGIVAIFCGALEHRVATR